MAEFDKSRPTTRSSAPGTKPGPSQSVRSGVAGPARHIITLIKGAHQWRFHLEPGNERDMLDAVAGCADDPSHPLDWFDAAIVSHQITRQIDANRPSPPPPPPPVADAPDRRADDAGGMDNRPADAA